MKAQSRRGNPLTDRYSLERLRAGPGARPQGMLLKRHSRASRFRPQSRLYRAASHPTRRRHELPWRRRSTSPSATRCGSVAVSDAARVAGIEKTAELRAPAGPAASLVGLTRDELAGQARRDRRARARAQDARRPSSGTGSTCAAPRSFDEMTNVGKGLRAALAEAYHPRPARGRVRAGLEGRHPQVADPHGVRPAPSTRAPRSSASTSPRSTAARCACRARSAAR